MNEQAENLPRGNGSVGADYNVIGVRPSSGAASTGCSDASDSIGARSRSDIAAPEDGRTPPRRSPAVADPVQNKSFDGPRRPSQNHLMQTRSLHLRLWRASAVLAIVAILASLDVPATESNPHAAQWESEIRAFETADETNPPPHDAVLFIGSSSIQKRTGRRREIGRAHL